MGLPKQGRIVAVSDLYRSRADQIGAKLKCRAYYDYRKMLESADVDAVIIATPDHWHALPSIHACQARKHVYTEKPLTLTIREGRVMVAAARKYRCAFQTGSQSPLDGQTPRGLSIGPCRPARQGAYRDRRQLSQPVELRPARAARPRGSRLGRLVRPDRAAALSRRHLHAAGQARLESRSRPTPVAKRPAGARMGWTRSSGPWAPTPRGPWKSGPKRASP